MVQRMATIYLGLGSNLGDREENVQEALKRLVGRDLRLLRVSSLYETSPVGDTPEPVPDYLNCVTEFETDLSPRALLEFVKSVEHACGRVSSFRWGPRSIDIDILLYERVTLDSPELTIPHPRLEERKFALVPLHELSPDLRLPSGIRIDEALNRDNVREQKVHRMGSK